MNAAQMTSGARSDQMKNPPNKPCLRRATRREFIFGVASVGVASLLHGSSTAINATSYKVGCYTRPWDQFDYRTALDGIAEAGFKYAGIMTAKGKSWLILNVESSPEDAQKVADEAKQRGLRILSVYAGEFPVERSVEAGIAGLRTLIDHCAICGCPDLMLAGTSNEGLVKDYCRVVSECCHYAATKGVRLSIKPHGGANATGPQCRQLIQRVGHPNFKLWYDPGNIFYYSDGTIDPADDSTSVDGLVAGVSVKDFRRPKEVMVTPGDGEVSFTKVFANLCKGGFVAGPVLIECLARPNTAAEITLEAKRARVFIEKTLAAI